MYISLQVVQVYIINAVSPGTGGAGVHIVARQSSADASVTAGLIRATDNHTTTDGHCSSECFVRGAACLA